MGKGGHKDNSVTTKTKIVLQFHKSARMEKIASLNSYLPVSVSFQKRLTG